MKCIHLSPQLLTVSAHNHFKPFTNDYLDFKITKINLTVYTRKNIYIKLFQQYPQWI